MASLADDFEQPSAQVVLKPRSLADDFEAAPAYVYSDESSNPDYKADPNTMHVDISGTADSAKPKIEEGGIGRQIGLTARYGIQALGNTVDMLASPIRGALNLALPDNMQAKPGLGKSLANLLSLPSPNTPLEHIVGDTTEMMAGGAGLLGVAGKVANATTGTTQALANMLAANPSQQIVSAGASGAAGGTAKEMGASDGVQTAAALAAGVAAPFASNKLSQMGDLIGRTGENLANKYVPSSAAANSASIDNTIDQVLQQNGMKMSDIPFNVMAGLRRDVGDAISSGGTLSPDSLRRLADYRLIGATPTNASLTLDPAMVTQQKNLAKEGINSKDASAQALGRLENTNNGKLIESLNDLGASQAGGKFNTGQTMLDRANAFIAARKGEISNLYTAAKDSQGRSLPIDPSAFTQKANDLLDYNMKGAFVPSEIRNMMNDFSTGKVPLNIHSAEQFKTIVGNAQRASNDGNVRAALGHIREALDDAPLIGNSSINGGNQVATTGGLSTSSNAGQDAIDAFNKARAANKAYQGQVESTPGLEAAENGAQPDNFFKQHVLNSSAQDLASLLPIVGKDAVKNEMVNHLKSLSVNGASDEVGKFSQSAYNKGLANIGDQKLSMVFNPEEMNQLKATGRVASYEQVQPSGSAVNNANTASTLMASLLSKVGDSPLLSKIPFGGTIAGPAKNIATGMQANQAMDIRRALALSNLLKQPTNPTMLLSPAAFMAGNGDKKDQSFFPRR